MITIVPLAGPGFVLPGGGFKPCAPTEGQPLLCRALETRPWWRAGLTGPDRLVLVLRDDQPGRDFAAIARAWYPGCRIAFLSEQSRGAALSVLAGAALIGDFAAPVCIDLADILYDLDDPVAPRFAAPGGPGGAVLTFDSDLPRYSYAALDAEGQVALLAEKRVISRYASAGTYVFADLATLLGAAAHGVADFAGQSCNGLLFVCPLLNGVIAAGRRVDRVPVGNVRDVKA